MTYVAHHRDFAVNGSASIKSRANKTGVLQRIFDTVFESRQKQADREIASFIAQRGGGGRITDDLEREMMTHLMSKWSSLR
jgi:hypothetical protein